MVQVIIADLSDVFDHESGYDCGGGYTDCVTVYVDEGLPTDKQLEVLLHEVIDSYIFRRKSNRLRHKDIDPLALEIIDALKQWEALHDQTQGTSDLRRTG